MALAALVLVGFGAYDSYPKMQLFTMSVQLKKGIEDDRCTDGPTAAANPQLQQNLIKTLVSGKAGLKANRGSLSVLLQDSLSPIVTALSRIPECKVGLRQNKVANQGKLKNRTRPCFGSTSAVKNYAR